jgi:hypothetical protein
MLSRKAVLERKRSIILGEDGGRVTVLKLQKGAGAPQLAGKPVPPDMFAVCSVQKLA